MVSNGYSRQAGLDADAFSGHSLRSGLATSAAEGGATERAIMGPDTAPLAETGEKIYPPRQLVPRQCGASKSGL